ncbi:helix-turn-helix domain-containing protein [Rhizobium phage RHph_N38]|uniref:Helix-turn-helix domain-containing protein n=1 Tax=Rhizobium phage RHph_N38 TaxID=2509750 RepID=A0A7S5RDL0_9CAUD|nr:helix-turn-helix domain-containing protein [Rhizobium phage RHph_N38]QIG70534.1 helix-turn-helix domain-containing protein [Rhizobium phage RHph_N38]
MASSPWRLSSEELEQAKTLLDKGVPRSQIAKQLKCSAPTIYRAFPVDIPQKDRNILKLKAKVLYLEEAVECLLKSNQSLLSELVKNRLVPTTLETGFTRSQDLIGKAKSLDSTQRRKRQKVTVSNS